MKLSVPIKIKLFTNISRPKLMLLNKKLSIFCDKFIISSNNFVCFNFYYAYIGFNLWFWVYSTWWSSKAVAMETNEYNISYNFQIFSKDAHTLKACDKACSNILQFNQIISTYSLVVSWIALWQKLFPESFRGGHHLH